MWKRVAINGARIAWLSLCVAALAGALNSYSGHSDWKTEEAFFFEMMVLCFPSSIVINLGIVLVGALLRLFGASLPMPSRPEMVCFFALFTAAGYAQWFIFLPRLLKFRLKPPDALSDTSRR